MLATDVKIEEINMHSSIFNSDQYNQKPLILVNNKYDTNILCMPTYGTCIHLWDSLVIHFSNLTHTHTHTHTLIQSMPHIYTSTKHAHRHQMDHRAIKQKGKNILFSQQCICKSINIVPSFLISFMLSLSLSAQMLQAHSITPTRHYT